MNLLVILSLIFSLSSQLQTLEEKQTDYLLNNIGSNTVQSEYLWAASTLYNYLPKEKKTYFVENLSNKLLANILKETGPRSALLKLAVSFKDENLLLAYLLNQPDKALRKQAYDEFYMGFGNLPLENVNSNVVNEISISFSDSNLINEPFAAFLLNHYYSVVRVVNKKYFEDFVLQHGNFTTNNNLLRDLINSAKFNSYYLLDRFSEIPQNYTKPPCTESTGV